MPEPTRPTALVLGASSGIGEALARQLSADGWRLGLVARRLDRLQALADACGGGTLVRQIDLAATDIAPTLSELIDALGGVDLVIVSAGTGHLNPTLADAPDDETLQLNVLGFATASRVAMRHFLERGRGHLVGIGSIAALRGSGAGAAYAASKAFVSVYLDGMRDLARHRRLPITVTEIQPGFVDTPMMKAEKVFWVASSDEAARQILRAVRRKAKHAYVTRRWALIAWLLRLLPRPG